ncbi:MAG TPA: hypothetical protein VFS33_00770 [Gemmatimonadales bacterium]|nr:hypothetical protein [Gemmatimonadales bacterium]
MRALVPALLLGTASLAACSDSTGTSNGPQGQVTLSLASQTRTAVTPSRASFDVTSSTPGTFSDGTNTLVLTKVQLVVRKIELEQHGAACAQAAVSASLSADQGSNGGGSDDPPGDDHGGASGDDDGCAELKLGPVLLDVPVTTDGAQQTLSVTLPAGNYDEFKFQIHKPEGSNDQAFLDANPAFAGTSIHVEGTWNGTPFTFNSGLTAVQKLELAQPLAVTANQTTDLTVLVDVSQWFTSGGSLLDPNTGNSGRPNQSVIENNIRASFHAFEDHDHDGEDDHGRHG